MSGEEHEERLKVAAKAADRSAVQSAQEALEAQGFLPHGLGSEVRKTGDRTRRDQGQGADASSQKEKGVGSVVGCVFPDPSLRRVSTKGELAAVGLTVTAGAGFSGHLSPICATP